MKKWSILKSLMLVGTIQAIFGEDRGTCGQQTYADEVKFTICSTNHIEDVKELLDHIYEEDKNIRWFIDELNEAIAGKWFINALNTQCVWLAYNEDKAVGMAVLRVLNPWWDDLANGKDRMELQSLLVSNAVRSRGIGRALYQVVENAAKTRGAKWLTLNAVAEAIPFYLKLGFEDAQKTRYGFFMKKRLKGPTVAIKAYA